MGTNLFGTSLTWSSVVPAIAVPASLLHFLLSWRDIRVLMSRWPLWGLLSGTRSTETILSICYDCFLLQTPLFSIIDFLCLLSQSDAFDLVSPELSKGRLRLSGFVTDSVSLMPADASLFCLEMIETIAGGVRSLHPMQIFLHMLTTSLRSAFFSLSRLLPSQWWKTLSQHLFQESRSMQFLNEAKRS